MRRFLAHRPEEGRKSTGCWITLHRFTQGMAPFLCLLLLLWRCVFHWIRNKKVGGRPGLPPLSMTSGPIQHFQKAVFHALQVKVATDLCKRQGIRVLHFSHKNYDIYIYIYILMCMALTNYLVPHTSGKGTKCCWVRCCQGGGEEVEW